MQFIVADSNEKKGINLNYFNFFTRYLSSEFVDI